jgi:hypothetical protein
MQPPQMVRVPIASSNGASRFQAGRDATRIDQKENKLPPNCKQKVFHKDEANEEQHRAWTPSPHDSSLDCSSRRQEALNKVQVKED